MSWHVFKINPLFSKSRINNCFNVFSKSKAFHGIIFQGKSFTITFCKPCKPLLFSISALGSFTCVTQHMGPTALCSNRRTEQWLSVLLKDTSVTVGDSNPHSADQKHQSLNPVLLTARPQHFKRHCLTNDSPVAKVALHHALQLVASKLPAKVGCAWLSFCQSYSSCVLYSITRFSWRQITVMLRLR